MTEAQLEPGVAEGLKASGICMAFGGVPVLREVDVFFRAGEVHGLLGENGAGKSTLAKILSGIVQGATGSVELDGQPLVLKNPHGARRLGLALIPQEPLVFPELEVAENVFAGHLPTRSFPRQVDWSRLRAQAGEWLDSLGSHVHPRDRTGSLSVADQQLIEMASALAHPLKVLFLDETTASLTPTEVKRLFAILQKLKDRGVAIVIISHRMEEIFSICDRVTILRDGEKVAEKKVAETSIDEVLRLMVGRATVSVNQKRSSLASSETVLTLKDWSGPGFKDIHLELRRGEITGLAGLVGAGRSELAQAMIGMSRATLGEMKLQGADGHLAPVRFSSPRVARAAGVVYLPEDRQTQANLATLGVQENLTLSFLSRLSIGGWIRSRSEGQVTARAIADFRIKCTDSRQLMHQLSGGNQQKVILARTLLSDPSVLILDEPTRGVDLAAKLEVHQMIQSWAGQGKAVLLISSDLPEVLALSDRILVLREGRLVAEYSAQAATAEKVIAAATGQIEMTDARSTPNAVPQAAPPVAHSLPMGRQMGILFFLGALLVAALAFRPDLFQWSNLRSLTLWIPLLLVLAVGQLGVILTRGIDVSAGAMVGLGGVVAGLVFREFPQSHYAWGCLAAAGTGVLLGGLNGLLVAWAKIPPIIATLGTLSVYRGMAFILSGGRQIDPHELPSDLLAWSRENVAHFDWFPRLLLVPLVVAVLAWWILNRTVFGRNLYAVGGNPAGAHARGISMTRTLWGVYTISGLLAGLAGVIYASRFGFINPGTTGVGLELTAIAAVVVGGANILGGSGTISGTVLGCLLLGVINVALAVLGVAGTYQLAVYGGIILLAISLDHGLHALWERRRQRKEAR